MGDYFPLLAGAERFERPNVGIKTQCLYLLAMPLCILATTRFVSLLHYSFCVMSSISPRFVS